MVYQFVTKDSIEEGIIASQKKKLALENVVVSNMDKKLNQTYATDFFYRPISSSDLVFSDLSTILKFGMKKMFEDDEDSAKVD